MNKNVVYVDAPGIMLALEEYTKLLAIDPIWLIEYLADMIAENDDALEYAIKTKDRDDVKSIIERHIY